MSDLKQRINDNVKDAMRAKEKERLKTLRLITSAIKQIEVDKRIELDKDDDIVAVLEKMLKQRKDSIEAFEKAGRDDLTAIEVAEVAIIKEYMPEQMSDEDVDALIVEAIAATGAAEMKDMGKVMADLKPRVQGRADMGKVSQKVKAAIGV